MTEYLDIKTAVKKVNPDLYQKIKKETPKIFTANDKYGYTFLIPDPTLNQKLISDSDFGRIVSALKIKQFVAKLQDFNNSLQNLLDQELPDCTSATQKAVYLNNGSEIREIALKCPNKLKCYLLTKKLIPTSSSDLDIDIDEEEKVVVPKKKEINHNISRVNFAKKVENEFYNEYCNTRDAYLLTVSSFMMFLKHNNPQKYTSVLPILGVDPCANFYILFEPYCRIPRIVSQSDFSSWYDVRGLYSTNCIKFYTNMFNDLDKTTILHDKRSLLIKKYSKLKMDLVNSATTSSIIDNIKRLYNTQAGSLFGVKNVYSAETIKLLNTPDLKLAHDEFRCIISPTFYSCAASQDKFGFKEQCKLVRTIYNFNNPSNQLMIVSRNQLENSLDPTMYVEQSIKPFILSSTFCNIPLMKGEAIGNYNNYNDIDEIDEVYEMESVLWSRIQTLSYKNNEQHLSIINLGQSSEL